MPIDDRRAMVMLSASPKSLSEVRSAVVSWAKGVGAEGEGVVVRCLSRIPDPPLEGTHFEDVLSDFTPFDIAADVWAPTAGHPAIESLQSLPGYLDGVVDLSECSALAGPQWRSRRPPGPLGLAFCLVRKPELDHEEFISYWRNEHTALPFPRLDTYAQFHVDPAASAALSELTGLPPTRLDGLSEPSYSDLDHFREISLDDRVRIAARDDELNFIDHSSSAIALFETVWSSN